MFYCSKQKKIFYRNDNADLHQARDQGRQEQQNLARENERLVRHLENLQHQTGVTLSHRSMDGTPLSMYSINSTSRKSSADPKFDLFNSPGGTPPSHRSQTVRLTLKNPNVNICF